MFISIIVNYLFAAYIFTFNLTIKFTLYRYGSKGIGNIPADQTLVFRINLIGIDASR